MTVHAASPPSADELRAVRRVLKQARAQGPDEFGCFVVEFEDGGTAEVFGEDLEQGCTVTVQGHTPALAHFLFDLLRAADWVMTPAMKGNPAITTAPVAIEGLDEFPRVVCTSAEELAVVLTKGVKAWRKYRDRSMGEG